jgi:capsular polysaccharide biosynthesis protein
MDSATLTSIAMAARRRWWLVIVALVLVMLADGVVTWRSPRSYLARASLLIGPSTTVDPGQLVYSIDALGRAMIVGTYANMLDTDVVRRDAFEGAGVPSATGNDVEIKSAVLADSAVVQVTVIAPDPDLAARVANAVGQAGELRMRQLYPMYDLTFVTPATPPAAAYRPDVTRNLSLGLLLGSLLGVSSAWGWDLIRRTGRVV